MTWLLHALTACIGLWCHGAMTWLLHALTAWDLKFKVCLGYTFTLATLIYQCTFTRVSVVDISAWWSVMLVSYTWTRYCPQHFNFGLFGPFWAFFGLFWLFWPLTAPNLVWRITDFSRKSLHGLDELLQLLVGLFVKQNLLHLRPFLKYRVRYRLGRFVAGNCFSSLIWKGVTKQIRPYYKTFYFHNLRIFFIA